jgi:hypothetical protein
VEFLSDEWFAAMSAALAKVEAPEGVELRIGQVITGTAVGSVSYVLDCRGGHCKVERGSTEDANVVFRSSLAVAQELADGGGSVAPGHAVLRGDVEVSGDVTLLLTAGDLAARLAEVMASVELQP